MYIILNMVQGEILKTIQILINFKNNIYPIFQDKKLSFHFIK